ncbi:MAG: class I SAM-dependent methyltransferase [Chthoniobacterales bacterium]
MPPVALRRLTSLPAARGKTLPLPRRFREIEKCRICGNRDLVSVLSLGEQYLTGVFPRNPQAPLSKGPMELVACNTATRRKACGLVQLRQSYDLNEMYGENYGYRSSLNRAMVKHLEAKVHRLVERHPLSPGDLVLDIGSNDGTLLSFYPELGVTVVGIDPSAAKFADYYREHISVIPDFFSAELFRARFGQRKAHIVTSIAMFYDLESPLRFMQDVASILDEEGVWHFEMSYLPAMLRTLSYDTICHEHLEYYSLKQIKWMTDRCGLKIINVEFNETNGGSFAVTAAQQSSSHFESTAQWEELLRIEETQALATAAQHRAFVDAVESHRAGLLELLNRLKAEGRTVLGYGASTKGNVLLQHCGITRELLPAIAEVNQDKFGCFTPGTHIPIISEAEAHALKPDYLFVLPWHFRDGIIKRESGFLQRGGKMIFPLPAIEVVSA